MEQNSKKYKSVKIILIFNLQVTNLSYSILTILYIHLKIHKTQHIDHNEWENQTEYTNHGILVFRQVI